MLRFLNYFHVKYDRFIRFYQQISSGLIILVNISHVDKLVTNPINSHICYKQKSLLQVDDSNHCCIFPSNILFWWWFYPYSTVFFCVCHLSVGTIIRSKTRWSSNKFKSYWFFHMARNCNLNILLLIFSLFFIPFLKRHTTPQGNSKM